MTPGRGVFSSFPHNAPCLPILTQTQLHRGQPTAVQGCPQKGQELGVALPLSCSCEQFSSVLVLSGEADGSVVREAWGYAWMAGGVCTMKGGPSLLLSKRNLLLCSKSETKQNRSSARRMEIQVRGESESGCSSSAPFLALLMSPSSSRASCRSPFLSDQIRSDQGAPYCPGTAILGCQLYYIWNELSPPTPQNGAHMSDFCLI